MLIVREVQEAALARGAWAAFEDTMVAHVRRHFPVDHALMGEAELRVFIRAGIERARARGFDSHGEMLQYIDLMLALGAELDRDPQIPWAKEILDAGGDIDALHDRAVMYLTQVAGKDGKIYARALLRLREATFEEIASDVHLEKLARWWPEKHEQIQRRRAMKPFLALVDQQCTPADRPLYGTLMFVLGSGFARDPQWAFARPALAAPPAERPLALYAAAGEHLTRALTLLRSGR